MPKAQFDMAQDLNLQLRKEIEDMKELNNPSTVVPKPQLDESQVQLAEDDAAASARKLMQELRALHDAVGATKMIIPHSIQDDGS